VANPIVKKLLELEIYKTGGIVDYSFSREILVIEIYDFLRLLHFTDDAGTAKIIRNNITGKTNQDKPKEVAAFLDNLNEKPIADSLKAIALNSASIFIGDNGVELIKAVIDTAQTVYKKSKK
jgi:hypothetical protein